MQLAPGEKFAIVRQLGDPTDTGTYYVQAVIRNGHTDDILDTVNLTDRGGRRFSNLWNVYSKKNDGFYIAITTTVYTDAAYTTKSDVYQEESETYLVERRDYHAGFSDGGVSYKKIKAVVDQALGGLPPPPEIPVADPYDDTALLEGVTQLSAKMDLFIEALKAVDVSPVVNVPAPKVDIAAIVEATVAAIEARDNADVLDVKAQAEAIVAAAGKISATLEGLAPQVADGVKGDTAQLLKVVEALAGFAKKDAPREPVPSPEEIIRSLRK